VLHWQLASAEAPLAAGSVLPASEETLAELVARSQSLAQTSQSELALAVGSIQDEHLNIALHTPDGSWGQKVKFNVNRHGLKARQDVVAMMALNMLRRWMDGLEISGGHGWIDVVETLRG